jgi:hypothetical protein
VATSMTAHTAGPLLVRQLRELGQMPSPPDPPPTATDHPPQPATGPSDAAPEPPQQQPDRASRIHARDPAHRCALARARGRARA